MRHDRITSITRGHFKQVAELGGYESVVLTLALAVEAKDPYTRGHSERVAAYAMALGKKLGLDDKDFQQMENDPSESMLEENEKIMLLFVLKSVKAPGSVTDKDIEGLRDHGWTDMDMLDALSQGVSMIDHSIRSPISLLSPDTTAERP